MRRLLLASFVVFLGVPLTLGAQTGRIGGTARDSLGQRIPDVGLLLMPGERIARTDPSGMYRFDSLPAGTYRLRVRRLGFLPMEEEIRLREGETRALDIALVPRPRILDTVTVTATGECPRTNFDGFLCRRKNTPGIFLSEEDILAKNATYLADIFTGMEGFRVEQVMTPYGGRREVKVEPSRCLTTLVNGRPFLGSDADLGEGDFYRPEHLIGIEIYPPGTQTPVEYGGVATGSRGPVGVGAVRGTNPPRGNNRPGMQGRVSRTGQPAERCLLINYWTPSAIRRPRDR
jgi:hypothetical protein